jgi:hypothetical protein
MSLRHDGQTIHLEGICRVEEAEALTALLQQMPNAVVDLTGCQGLHAAVAQVLLALAPPLTGNPADEFLKEWLLPALARARHSVPRHI